ncbi:hypothetical protein PMPD1_3129 [Paramixta manurensis]|uniref:Uncharacterized protein n=1 Tax=Paramixta manurensis TaxID=2740817 RepID=A0A6M8UE55_9GAMM|nr:hypothetical protein PMPD1_3129 [Erwiniaceae bacterium PD-1]
MKIKLTYKDRLEIESIIENLSESDNELIYEQVKNIIDKTTTNPAEMSMCAWLPKHFDYPIIELCQEDTLSQDLAHQFIWDYLTRAAKWEYAVSIFKNKYSYSEVA